MGFRNFEPDWGLYNGSIGTVKEIVFKKGESPLDGTLPQYVIVEFLVFLAKIYTSFCHATCQ